MSDKLPDKRKPDDLNNPLSKIDDWFLQPFPFNHVLESIDDFFKHSLLKPSFKVNVKETNHNYIVYAELPGVKKEDISISIMENSITISAYQTEIFLQEDDVKKTYQKKSSYQKISRTIPFYHPINEKKSKASFQNGLLTITLNKKSGKSIPIE